MSSSSHIVNKKKDILVIGRGPTQWLKHTLTVNGTEIYKFKSKDSEIVPSPLCLWNISKD